MWRPSFFDNHVPDLDLRTVSQGAQTLDQLREYMLRKLAGQRGDSQPLPKPRPSLPFM